MADFLRLPPDSELMDGIARFRRSEDCSGTYLIFKPE
jgi:hypothetical protein